MNDDYPAPTQTGSAFYEVRRAIALGLYKAVGWRFYGEKPEALKFIVIAAPHTSNWDFPLMLAAAYYFRIRLKWMGKDTLFKGPFGPLMRALGGISIDRSKSNNVVAQMIEIYRQADTLAVAIPPEGTRSKVKYWKTGFYNIAVGADAPIMLGFVDYKRKVSGIGGQIMPTGDYDSDLEDIKKFYATISPKHQDRSD